MGVSKNRGTPKWMVKRMENPIKTDDLGVTIILGNTPYTVISNHACLRYLLFFYFMGI